MGNNSCCCCRSERSLPPGKINPDIVIAHPIFPKDTPLGPVNNVEDRYKPAPTKPAAIPTPQIVVAMYGYDARDSQDLSFRKGDRMAVLGDSEGDWLQVEHLGTKDRGYVPGNYVAPELSVRSEDWFFEKISRKEIEKLLMAEENGRSTFLVRSSEHNPNGYSFSVDDWEEYSWFFENISRKEAEKLLMAEENGRGTFLVRPSEHNPNGYSLSVKDWEEYRTFHIKHYKIKPLDNGGFYISTNKTFASLSELVTAYTKNAFGLCHVLAKPCKRPQPTMWDLAPTYRDKWEIQRDELILIRRLGRGNFGEVFYGKWKNNIEVAVKTLREATMSTAAFLQEAAIMKNFRHKRLVAVKTLREGTMSSAAFLQEVAVKTLREGTMSSAAFLQEVAVKTLREGTMSSAAFLQEVAVKTLREGTMSTAAFLQEAAIMKKFRHKRLVALFGVCSEQEPIYIVAEYMCKGSLLDFLRKDEGRALIFEDLVYIAFQVASGMEYLESKQLIHRDLAARNVLIGENNVAKICDFGLARVIEDNEYCPQKGSRFPVKWTAPEAIIYGRFSIKSDVWSYGILLMELFTYGQVPYPAMHGREVIELVESGYRMPKPTAHHVPDEIYQIMLNTWDVNPEKRPTFEFLTHYFEGFNVTSEVPYREVPD